MDEDESDGFDIEYDYGNLSLIDAVNEIYSIINELKLNSTEKGQLLALYKHIQVLINQKSTEDLNQRL